MQIAFNHISMAFGGNQVLHDITLAIPQGSIFALLGENGAGKSTLMNLLGGVYSPASGEVLLDGIPVHFRSPRDAIRHGIGFIHQELNPVNGLTVYENIFLGREKRKKWGLLDREGMRCEAREILQRLEVDLDETVLMNSLDTSQKQIVTIARALLFKAKVLIMDEPTTSLAGHEIERLFDLVKKLATDDGVTVLFISHKLDEVKSLCTDYAVLRNGSLVTTGKIHQVSCQELSEWIVGRELTAWTPSAANKSLGAVVLQGQSLSRQRKFQDVSFAVHQGEILGFTGLLGGGHRELFQSIFGDEPDFEGSLLLNGKPFHANSTVEAVAAGIAYTPGNRKENAIFPDMNVLANGSMTTLASISRCGIIQKAKQKAIFAEKVGPFHLKCQNVEEPITSLSGGNQQKVILARWLSMNPKVLILDNPTQGVDIGAKQEIYECIRKIAASGVAVIVISGEGQEIQRICHRALVMSHGEVVGELEGDAISEGNIMNLATGAKLFLCIKSDP